MKYDTQDLVVRFDALESERKGSVEGVWDMIERFVLPLRGDFYSSLNSENEVDWRRREIYDSTAVFNCQALAASIHGNLTSPGQLWFALQFRDDELNEEDSAREWLDDATQRIYNALGDSNFDIEIAEAYLDLCGFGTAVLVEEYEEGKLNFSAVPLRECYFEEDHNKKVAVFYRKLQWTPAQMVSKFGDDGVPQDILELANAPQSAELKKDVLFVIYPRETPDGLDLSKPVAEKSRPFGYRYILRETKQTLGEESGYYEMPAFVSRWRKTAGSRWGHSPGTIALADILTLNQLKEATLEAAGKAVDPANLAEENVIIGDLNLDRGDLTIVTDINGLKPYESGTRFDVSNMEIGMLIDSIRQAFFQDKLELKESPAMTATEVNVRYELMQRLLGPTFGRLKTDLLDPLVQRAFNIMYREGKLQPLPETIAGAELDIEYTGPLARSQKFDIAQGIKQFLMEIAQLSEVYPEARDVVDIDGAIREIAKMQGVPASATRGQAEIDEDRAARAKQEQEMQQLAAAQGAGEAMKSVGEGAQAVQGMDPAMGEALSAAGGMGGGQQAA